MVTGGSAPNAGRLTRVFNTAFNHFVLSVPLTARWLIARRFNRAVEERLGSYADTESPDFVLFIKGHQLTASARETIEQIKAPKAQWTYDSLARFPGQCSLMPLVDRVFVMDGGDRDAHGRTWLPLGYDVRVFEPRGEPFDYDVALVGRANSEFYRSRVEALLELSDSDLPSRFRCCFAGSTSRRVRSRVVAGNPHLKLLGTRRFADYAALIRRSRVCINVHQDDGIQPINPMFFAIPGAQVCQVCDDRPYLAEWLTPGLHYVPFTKGSLADVVGNLLSDNRRWSTVAADGYRECRDHHSYVSRMEAILRAMGFARRVGCETVE